MSDKRELPTADGGPGGERCDRCRFWWPNYKPRNEGVWETFAEAEDTRGQAGGACRRFPPQVVPRPYTDKPLDGGTDADFPLAWSDWWCGEWKAKPEATA